MSTGDNSFELSTCHGKISRTSSYRRPRKLAHVISV